jgi:hypothetical protein
MQQDRKTRLYDMHPSSTCCNGHQQVGSVANSAGVGGGVIFVPLLQALVGFALKDATALSQVSTSQSELKHLLHQCMHCALYWLSCQPALLMHEHVVHPICWPSEPEAGGRFHLGTDLHSLHACCWLCRLSSQQVGG